MSQVKKQPAVDNNTNWQKNIVLFLGSQTISLFGSSIVQFAVFWHITLTTQSGVMMTIYTVSCLVPSFFLSPFAGVWADRFSRKMLIIGADALIAVVTLVLAILFFMGYDTVWLLFFIAAVRAAGTGIQTPAVGAVLPQIVPEDKLTKVNGINGSIQATVNLLSPMVSAALFTVVPMKAILLIDVITASIAIFILAFLHIPVHAKASQKQTVSYFSDLKQGFNYIKNHDFLKTFFVFFAFFYVLVAPAAFLTPLQVTRSFGSDVWHLTALEITFSIGMMLGGIIMASWGGFKNKAHTMILSMLISGVCTFALGVVPVFAVYLVFMGITGITIPLFNTPSTVLLQEKVEENYLGRVFGVLTMISTSMMPLGMLVFGPISDIIKIEWLLIGTGALVFLLGFVMLSNKTLIQAGR